MAETKWVLVRVTGGDACQADCVMLSISDASRAAVAAGRKGIKAASVALMHEGYIDLCVHQAASEAIAFTRIPECVDADPRAAAYDATGVMELDHQMVVSLLLDAEVRGATVATDCAGWMVGSADGYVYWCAAHKYSGARMMSVDIRHLFAE